MSEDDKKVFQEGRPYLVGIIAVLFGAGRVKSTVAMNFEEAERYVVEFERLNGIAK